LKFDSEGRHYNQSRSDVFWRLDEMREHEARTKALQDGKAAFAYKCSREWADHIADSGSREQMPKPLQKLSVPLSADWTWTWCKEVDEAARKAAKKQALAAGRPSETQQQQQQQQQNFVHGP
jgi:hypothetical protein